MDDKQRGQDAQDRTPASNPSGGPQAPDRQDDPNNAKPTDKGQVIKVEDLNSANDEGAQ